MSLNIDNAIRYMFKDKDCKRKFLIGPLFMIGMVVINLLNQIVQIIGD